MGKFPWFRNQSNAHPPANLAALFWSLDEKRTFGYLPKPSPQQLQFRFKTTNWWKERGVLDEPLQVPKYEEVSYTFTFCNNIELWTPQCVSAVLLSLVSCTSAAEINKCENTWFWGGEAWDKHPFCGKQQCQVGWSTHCLHKRKKGARAWKWQEHLTRGQMTNRS